jgi:hypothetical protein
VGVVLIDVLGENPSQVASPGGGEDAVGAFAADAADPPMPVLR